MRILSAMTLLITFSSCSSYFTRQTCEKTNWFEYGQAAALEGRRLTGDAFIKQCYEAEADVAESDLDRGFKAGMAKYCQPETVYQTGKNGNFFSTEMCEGQGLKTLKERHWAGVLEYCRRDNGYAAGAKGKPYNKICPGELEKAFLPEFNRGRVRYLGTVKSQNEAQISELNREVSKVQSELNYKKGILVGLQVINPATATKEQNERLSRLNSDVSSLQSRLTSIERKKESLTQENRKLEIEMVQLGN